MSTNDSHATDVAQAQRESINALIPVEVQPDPIPAPKRPRGRPRKNPVTTEEAVYSDQADLALDVEDLDPRVAELFAQMQDEINTLRNQGANPLVTTAGEDDTVVDTGPGGWPWQYYKRRDETGDPQKDQMAGWVVYGPGGKGISGRDTGALSNYMTKGMKPLTHYGVAPIPSDVYGKPPGSEFIPILANGGVREFPATQVLAYRWHVRCPVPGTKFPQLAEVKEDIREFECDECDFNIWFLETDRLSVQSLFTHLSRQHAYTRAEARRALEAQGIAPAFARFARHAAIDALGLDVPSLGEAAARLSEPEE